LNNSAEEGVVYARGEQITLIDCTFYDNGAHDLASLDEEPQFVLANCKFSGSFDAYTALFKSTSNVVGGVAMTDPGFTRSYQACPAHNLTLFFADSSLFAPTATHSRSRSPVATPSRVWSHSASVNGSAPLWDSFPPLLTIGLAGRSFAVNQSFWLTASQVFVSTALRAFTTATAFSVDLRPFSVLLHSIGFAARQTAFASSSPFVPSHAGKQREVAVVVRNGPRNPPIG
jgi:hypothetical protein